MLTTKRSLLLLTTSICALSLVNCSDNDTVPGAEGGGSGKAGSSAASGAAGKAGSGNPGGSNGEAGSPDETAGTGSGDAGAGNASGASGSGNAGDSGVEGGKGGSSGSIGSSGSGGSAGSAGSAGKGGSAGSSGAGGAGGSGGKGGSGGTSGSGGSGGSAGKGGSGGTAGSAGSAGSGGSAGAAGPHQAPILNYAFNEGTGTVAVDSSPSGLNGTLATPSWTANGRTGSGLALAGGVLPATFVKVPPGVFTNVKSTTIGAWVKLAANVPWSRIFDFGGTGVDAAARFMYLTPDSGGGGIRFSTYGGSAAREATITSGTLLPLNVWKHVAVTAEDGGKRAIYIDGYPAARATTVNVLPSELEPLSASSWLGKSRFDADGGLNGVLDDFVVYDRVLSSAEIATLAFPKADYSRLAFDEAAGTTSADASERGVNATLTDTTWASGVSGAAVLLSGTAATAQYVTLNNPIAGCTSELTVALWVKQTSASPWARIFDFGGPNDNFMFLTPSNADGKLQLNIHAKPPVPETTVISATAFPVDAAWHHVAVVISSTVASLYIDGSVVGNAPTPVTPAVLGATNEHWLGKSRFPDAYFKGSFDELRIACRALTSDEIKNLAFH
jgi:hypothetical protein